MLDDFDKFSDENNIIKMRQFSIILRVLKQFGNLITHLSIFYSSSNKLSMGVPSINKISESINLHCSNTLEHFEIFSQHETFFDEMVTPFVKVKKLSIHGKFNNLRSDTLGLPELFPAVRLLRIEHIDIRDTSGIDHMADHEYPHMDQLQIEISRYSNPSRFTEENAFKLLKKNPQIRHLELDKTSRTFLLTANEVLPLLESLRLVHYFPFHGESKQTFIFENVKNFSIAESCESAPQYVEFRNLIEYHTENLFGLLYNKWVQLVEKSPHLQKLFVNNVNDEYLLKITAIDLNLIEVNFGLETDVSDETIVNFIRKNERSKKIHFTRNEMQNTFKGVAVILHEQFADKWIIKETKFSLFLERY